MITGDVNSLNKRTMEPPESVEVQNFGSVEGILAGEMNMGFSLLRKLLLLCWNLRWNQVKKVTPANPFSDFMVQIMYFYSLGAAYNGILVLRTASTQEGHAQQLEEEIKLLSSRCKCALNQERVHVEVLDLALL